MAKTMPRVLGRGIALFQNRRGRWFLALMFEPRDLWVGVYWKRSHSSLDLYVCLLPTLPLWFARERGPANDD